MAALQIVGGLAPSHGPASFPLRRPRLSSCLVLLHSKCASSRIHLCLKLVHKDGVVGVRTSYLHGLEETLEGLSAYVPNRQQQQQLNARISASLDSGGGKTDDTRKALEQMFTGKSNLSKKLEEEIQKREIGGRDGSGSGGSGGGGGRGGGDDMNEGYDDDDEHWDWQDARQTFIATFILVILYFSITHGPKQVFKLFRLFFRWLRQGFTLRKIPDEFLEGPETEDEEDEESHSGNYSDDDRPSGRKPNIHTHYLQDNDEYFDGENMNKDSYSSPEHQKGKRIVSRQAQQNEKMMQKLIEREPRRKGD